MLLTGDGNIKVSYAVVAAIYIALVNSAVGQIGKLQNKNLYLQFVLMFTGLD